MPHSQTPFGLGKCHSCYDCEGGRGGPRLRPPLQSSLVHQLVGQGTIASPLCKTTGVLRHCSLWLAYGAPEHVPVAMPGLLQTGAINDMGRFSTVEQDFVATPKLFNPEP